MSLTPPNRIVIDFLEGISSRADAVAYARGFINSHFDVPLESGFYVMPYKDGYAFEVHEGGSRLAYLPGILRRIEENQSATISIRAGARVLQVSKGARDNFNSVLLPEELSSYLENVIEPDDRAPHLIPYQVDNIVWLVWGAAMISIGFLVLIFAMGFHLLAPRPKFSSGISLPVQKLPISQWKVMADKLDSDHYISQMKFENGSWMFDVKANEDADQKTPAANPTEPDTAGTNSVVVIPNAGAPAAPPTPTTAATGTP